MTYFDRPTSPWILSQTLARWVPALFVAALMMATPAACGGGTGQPPADREVLVALYNATDGPNWRVWDFQENNWLSNEPIGEWYGVTADEDGRVVKLELFGFGLNGEIPAELGSLADLIELHLGNSLLSGEIPPELGGLSNLEVLDLGGNDWEDSELTGAIPPELGRLSNLKDLYLSGNRLSGGIPAELGNLANLETLWLDANRLSGEIPAELGNLANLAGLRLSGNQLSGEIPAELGNPALAQLYLSHNELSGCIPNELENVPDNDFDRVGLAFC